MLYGILLESCRDGISTVFGRHTWRRIVQELNLGHETFTILGRYEENLIEKIAECLSNILRESSPDLCMEFFGECFVRFFTTYGYDKILRVAGRHFRDFLHAIDQLHDSNRFSFPDMKSPLFSVAEEDEQGVVLMYKSRRRGFQHYVVGQLRECAMNFYNETIQVTVKEDLSTDEYTRIMFRVDFNNEIIKQTNARLMKPLTLPDIKSSTFFKVFPFCVMIDPEMRISHLGPRLKSLFSGNISVIGKHISDIFTVLRPDILHVEWQKFLNYGKSVVFVIQSCIPLKDEAKKQNGNLNKLSSSNTGSIKLKGQMKYIPSWNRLAFLCHPMLTTTEEMLSIGLFLNDLNFYDGSSEILISGIQHARQLQKAIEKQHAWVKKLQQAKSELQEYRKRGRRLLYSMMPRHVAQMLQQGILPNSICESHKLLTTLFSYLVDIQELTRLLPPEQMIDCINQTIKIFDTCAEKFDVYRVETNADSGYLIVAGIHDRNVHNDRRGSNTSVNTSYTISSAGGEYHHDSPRQSGDNNSHRHKTQEESNMKNDFHLIQSSSKNAYDLNQAEIISLLALELMEALQLVINPLTKQPIRIKFGFHSGSAVGGIVGTRKYQYCLFGDTINTASCVATCGQIGKINFSAASYELLKNSPYFETAYRGNIEMKGQGLMDIYLLLGRTQTYLSLLELAQYPIQNVSELVLDHSASGDLTLLTCQRSFLMKNNILKDIIEKKSFCPLHLSQI